MALLELDYQSATMVMLSEVSNGECSTLEFHTALGEGVHRILHMFQGRFAGQLMSWHAGPTARATCRFFAVFIHDLSKHADRAFTIPSDFDVVINSVSATEEGDTLAGENEMTSTLRLDVWRGAALPLLSKFLQRYGNDFEAFA